MIDKVLGYVLRTTGDTRELLVFTHRDHPEAGVQVPAGTVESGESITAALARELAEETGLTGLSGVQRLTVAFEPEYQVRRHIFVAEAPPGTPDAWEHPVTGTGEDQGLVFSCTWVALDQVAELAGDQHRWLDRLGPVGGADGPR